jgi:rfaE bifunctional protein nucleotidyltransferase chain/domain
MLPAFENKFCEPADLPKRLESLARPLVFTNGVFDILHRGHVTYLAEARAHGKNLVVALNSDASAKRLEKGEDRPLNALRDRMAVVAALECVDLVTWFDEDTPIEVIRICQPNVLVKGGDWKKEEIVGAKEVEARGGQVFSIPFQWATSTSSLVERIRRQKP